MNKQVLNNSIVECAHDQIAVTSSVDTTPRGGVKKFLGLSAECKVYTVEAMNGEAKITGKVCYKVIYLDKENKTTGVDYFCDFSESIVGNISPTDKISVTQSVVDVVGKMDGDTITVTAVCDFVLKRISCDKGESLDFVDGVFVNREIMELVTIKDLRDETFDVSHQEESGTKVDKVLYFGTSPLITSVMMSENGATVDGFVQTEIVYLSGDNVYGKSFQIPFKEEVEAEHTVDVRASIKSSRLVLSGDETNNLFEVEVFVTLGGFDVGIQDDELVTDAFSTTKHLSLQREKLECTRFDFCKSIDFPICGQAELPVVAEVLASPVLRVNIANVISGKDQVTVEGLVVCTLLYKDKVTNSVLVELPFSVSEQLDGINMGDRLCVDAVVTDFTTSLSAGVVTFKATLKTRISVYKTHAINWVTSLVEGEDKPKNPNGISIYYVNAGDSVWDIAKAVNISPNEVLQLNPDIEEKSQGTKRVIVFRKSR